MSIITTYVCDVSGVSGNDVKDFVKVNIRSSNGDNSFGSYGNNGVTIDKLIHKDVATKLNLVKLTKEEEATIPKLTLEAQMLILLRDYIQELAQGVVEDNQQ